MHLLSKCRVDWKAVSRHQTLSQNTIRKFKNRVDWVSIAAYQQVSEDFKKEFKDSTYSLDDIRGLLCHTKY